MKKMILFVIAVLLLCDTACARQFDELVEKYSVENKADVITVSNAMMKVARLFVGGKEKNFFKMIDDMSILSLKDCSTEVKEAFLEEIISIDPQGYEAALHTDKKGYKTRVFAKESGEKGVSYKMVVASVENKGDVALMIMNGKFILSEVVKIFK